MVKQVAFVSTRDNSQAIFFQTINKFIHLLLDKDNPNYLSPKVMSLIGIHWRTLVSIRFLFLKYRYRRSQRTPSIRDLAVWNLIFVQIARPEGDLRSRLWTDGEALIAACCVYVNYAANRFTSRRGRDGTRAPPATAAISDLLFCHSTPQIAWNANFITLPMSRRYDVQIALTPSEFRASNSRQLERR